MATHSAIAVALTLVLMLAAGCWSVSDKPRMIKLNSNGTKQYRDTPLFAHISEVLDIDCQDVTGISLYSVTKEDYDNCTLPVLLVDGGTSIQIGDCPRLIKLVLATNIVSNSVNYMIGGTYYYAAYGVDNLYEVVNAVPCQEGVKFKIHIEEEKDEEPSVSPSSSIVLEVSETTETAEITETSVLVITPTTTPTPISKPTTSTTQSTERTEPSRGTLPPGTRPFVDSEYVIVEGAFDSAVSQYPNFPLLTFLCFLVVTVISISRLL